jgi:hypothetical protein
MSHANRWAALRSSAKNGSSGVHPTDDGDSTKRIRSQDTITSFMFAGNPEEDLNKKHSWGKRVLGKFDESLGKWDVMDKWFLIHPESAFMNWWNMYLVVFVLLCVSFTPVSLITSYYPG